MRSFKTFSFLFTIILFISCGLGYNKLEDIAEYEKLYEEGQYEAAKTLVTDYLKEKPDNEFAWEILGDLEYQLGNDVAAVKAYTKALDMNPNAMSALVGMGIQSRLNKEYDKAIEYYTRALKINPNDPDALTSLSVVYIKERNFEKAIETGTKALLFDRKNGVILANLSIAYHYNKDFENRDRCFRLAKKYGYKNIETLQQIYRGELSALD